MYINYLCPHQVLNNFEQNNIMLNIGEKYFLYDQERSEVNPPRTRTKVDLSMSDFVLL